MTLEEGINFRMDNDDLIASMDVSYHIFCDNIVTMLKQKSYGFCTDIEAIFVQYFYARSCKTLHDFQLYLRLLEGKIAAISSGFKGANLRNFDAKDDVILSSDLQNERSENDPN